MTELFVVVDYRLYPVDKTRVNEFGQSFEGDVKQKPSTSSSQGNLESKKQQ